MKIIIAGDGKVGLTLTQKLAAAGHDLTLIDSNQRVLDSSVERYDVMGVQGNCASMRVLESADVKKAEVTTLGSKKEGDIVNLETDIIGKYVEKLLHPQEEKKESHITREFLENCGF